MANFVRDVARSLVVVAAAFAAGCGGGGGGDGGNPPQQQSPPPPPASGWVAGSFLPAASFAGKCVNPRAGTDPLTGLPFNEVQGTATDENNFLRSWSNDLYLWYNEIVDRDPGLYATPAYFDLLKTPAKTTSGAEKDRFHFTYPTSEWLALIEANEQVGYGAVWSIRATTNPPEVRVAYTEPNSPASEAPTSLVRGETVVAVDGVSVNALTNASVWNAFFAGLFPSTGGETHGFWLVNPNNGEQRSVIMTATTVTTVPVRNVGTIDTGTGAVGYIQFNDHLPLAEPDLIDAFTTLAQQNVTDLVLDLRYNGGGALALASEVAYMIAGPALTAGQTFEELRFNDKHLTNNPLTGGPLPPMPFFNTSSTNQPLPTLNLGRVFVLTGPTTCSASESIMNGLRGVNVEVIQIGSTTCGKPYGFLPEHNCGTTYFTIQFQGVNAAGYGDYGDGFTPQNTTAAGAERLPGCSVLDDLSRPLGDPLELRLAAALHYRATNTCPGPPTGFGPTELPGFTKPGDGPGAEANDGVVTKPVWLSNRWLDRR